VCGRIKDGTQCEGEKRKLVRKGLRNVYITDKEAKLIDEYIQQNYMELKAKGKANRSAVVRMIVKFWAKQKGLTRSA